MTEITVYCEVCTNPIPRKLRKDGRKESITTYKAAKTCGPDCLSIHTSRRMMGNRYNPSGLSKDHKNFKVEKATYQKTSVVDSWLYS